MKTVIQRVESVVLTVENKEVSRISEGLICYLGIASGDSEEELKWMAKKVANLRIFPDSEGKMNLSAIDKNFSILVVSQFTLFGDIKRGYRPSFSDAETPARANDFYQNFISALKENGIKEVKGGVFGADMTIEQINRGPVTIIIDSRDKANT
ncbi:MAG: D-tyrosyl-tRNA(Tyr) deacylase [Candidatus Riflebacteria bacterium]|nr:D-tyrosyl-tRNA(Tyr) deacylase [Candidatus Riflebacteria bacterium]